MYDEEVKRILREVRDTAILLERFDVSKYPPNNSFVHQICQLFEPKPDGDRFLKDEEIRRAWQDCYGEPLPEKYGLVFGRVIRHRQLAKCDAEIEKLKADHQIELQMLGEEMTDKFAATLERIKREIALHFKKSGYNSEEDYNWWQDFWVKEGNNDQKTGVHPRASNSGL